MSTSVPFDGGAGAPAPLPSLPLGDEEALHRVFLTEYPTLAAEARADLGDEGAGFGAHVVEGAFVRAWDARDRLSTPESVHDFLVEDVHHAAARALSRRAIAHRIGTHSAPPTAHVQHSLKEMNPDEAWMHIQHALHGDAHTPDAIEAAMAISRHETAEHIATVEKARPWWIAVAAVIAMALVVWGGLRWADRASADSRLARAVNASDARVVTSAPAQIGVVTLAEGTGVRLAPDSKLSIPKDFGPDVRAVKLQGAAAFNVAPNQPSDFQVHTDNAVIVAKGTAFTVRDYANDPGTTIIVTEGAVDVRHGDRTDAVRAGSSRVVPTTGNAHPASAVERDAADAWRTGTVVINDEPLGNALPELKRWYGLDIHVPHTPLLERHVSVRASLDSSHAAIRQIEQSANVQFGYVGTTMVFQEPDKSAAPAKPKAKKR